MERIIQAASTRRMAVARDAAFAAKTCTGPPFLLHSAATLPRACISAVTTSRVMQVPVANHHPAHFLDARPVSGSPCRHHAAPEAPANFATGSVFLGGGYYSRTPPNDLAASVVEIDPASYLVGAAGHWVSWPLCSGSTEYRFEPVAVPTDEKTGWPACWQLQDSCSHAHALRFVPACTAARLK